MATSDARPVARKGVAYRVYFPILDADGDLVSGAAGLDSEVSKDGGAFTDCTNEATEIATSSGMYYLELTASEMDADAVCVIVKTSTSGAKTTPLVIYPEEAGDLRVDVVQISGDTAAADNLEAASDGTGYNLGGGAMVAASVTAGVTLAASAVQAIWDAATSALSVAGSIGKLLVDRIDAAITSRSTVTTAQVNAEVVDVLTVDTLPELAQAQPQAEPTFRAAVMLLYMSLRNRLTQTASQMSVHNDAGAVICKSATSDDGTTFTRDKLANGP